MADKSAATLYKVGDCVYFENSGVGPYSIRRIEELNRNTSGNVEARVTCFYRRCEIPTNLIHISDKHHWGEVDMEQDSDDEDSETKERLDKLLHKQREVFLSRHTETLPSTLIRGKCSVTLLSEVEEVSSYTSKEDSFFYALVYDPQMKTLQADRGSIRIGSEYQAVISPVLPASEAESEEAVNDRKEELIWDPSNKLTEDQINQFIIIAKSVGTFARALDCSSSVKQPSLHMSAAAACRDITVLHAYQTLHSHKYNLSVALASLVPTTGPVLCRDEMEDWSSAEASLFEEAVEKYGKDFKDIKKDFLPWKSMKNILEYFFMWKTTDRYVQQKKTKAIENESKLKQVQIPVFDRKNSRLASSHGEVIVLGKDCDAYPSIPKYCWSQFKKYGRYVQATTTEDCFIIDKAKNSGSRFTAGRPGLVIEPGSPGKSGKSKAAFFLRTTPVTRAARRLCATSVKLVHHARKPNKLIDIKSIRSEFTSLSPSSKKVRDLCSFKARTRDGIPEICRRLGQTDTEKQDWLVIRAKKRTAAAPAVVEAFPRPAKRKDGSYIYNVIPSAVVEPVVVPASRQQMLYKKRPYDEKPVELSTAAGGGGGGGRRGGGTQMRSYSVNQVAPKGKLAGLSGGGQRGVVSWQEAPDDMFYRASTTSKKARKEMTVRLIRQAARKPFKKIIN